MKPNRARRLLAVGLDAAEPSFIRQKIEAGEMPVLGRLLGEGTWSRVESPAPIGSGTVWPTFFTGTEPREHGTYSDWLWHPASATLEHYDGQRLVPFWKSLADGGRKVGVLDVPFAPLVGLREGFEISEWGAHDAFEGRISFAPETLSEVLMQGGARHPFSAERHNDAGAHNVEALKRLAADCLEGARLRGELSSRLIRERETEFSLIVFPEIHHASHKLWHTVAPEHELYALDELNGARHVEPTLAELLREIDVQIGRLIEAAGGDKTAVVVFSLHGMKPARGLPAFLPKILCAHSFSQIAGFGSQSWTERALSLFALMKRRAPAPLKKLYYRSVPQEMTQKLAQPTMIPAYDWSRTRAFALPSDQNGWIRINLAGREAKGCVPVERYDETCAEIEETLRALSTEDGRPLVREVIRTAESAEDSLSCLIPDIVVHWEDAAFELPMRARGLLLEAHRAATGITGQHAHEGFCITRGHKNFKANTINATQLHRVIEELMH